MPRSGPMAMKKGIKFEFIMVLGLMFGHYGLLVWCDTNKALVPALCIFGDSILDVGNNDYYVTLAQANFPPYGRDFINHMPTGRFSNGKLLSDFTAEILGLKYPSAYLSPEASGENLLIGANFASAGSGILPSTAALLEAIPLFKQLENYKMYQAKLEEVAGSTKAKSIIKDAFYLISLGNNDYINYVFNPVVNRVYTRRPDEFASRLVALLSSFIEDLYGLGARRIGVLSILPLGCTPLAITLFGLHDQNDCITALNIDAQLFNQKLKSAISTLSNKYSDIKLVFLDIETPLYEIFQNPYNYGFTEARLGCCGTGIIELTKYLCNPLSIKTCTNASEYVYFDVAHPSQATNQILADTVISRGIHQLIN